jgi:hypothetical protein
MTAEVPSVFGPVHARKVGVARLAHIGVERDCRTSGKLQNEDGARALGAW